MEKEGNPQRLYRSRKERVVAGISGGLGEYFNVDPIIFRLLFVILTFVNGIGVLIYLLLWITVPREGEEGNLDALHIHATIKEKMDDMESHFKKEKDVGNTKHVGRGIFALALVVVGVLALISNLLSLRVIRFDIAWPVIVIIIGLYLIFRDEH